MINYSNLVDSINYYTELGYTRIETPWTVSEEVLNITKPKDSASYRIEHTGKCLVGSAEQSFLYLYTKGYIPKGKFQSITPCFRDEYFDYCHTKYFIKNELINTEEVSEDKLIELVKQAEEFFRNYSSTVDVGKHDEGYDIYVNGIEVGSYGIRHTNIIDYIYGTACAEPRLTKALRLVKNGLS